jgi:hypothetical protein
MSTLADDAVLEEWAFLAFGEDVPDLAEAELIEVNSDMLRCMAVAHPVGASVPVVVPEPTYRMTRGTAQLSLWFLKVPIEKDEDKPKPVNAHRMVTAMLAAALGGVPAPYYPNPLSEPESMERTTAGLSDITTMRIALNKAGFARHRFDLDARRNGGRKAGEMTTEAQTQSRRANLVAAREARQRQQAKQADARARDLVAMAEAGASDAEIAERYGLALASVATTLARARLRVQPQDRRLDLEEFVELLSS